MRVNFLPHVNVRSNLTKKTQKQNNPSFGSFIAADPACLNFFTKGMRTLNLEQVERLGHDIQRAHANPFFSVYIIPGGRIVLTDSEGYVLYKSIYEIDSPAKFIRRVANALMKAEELGKEKLNLTKRDELILETLKLAKFIDAPENGKIFSVN
ncbi:MAG: hypothetical protein PHC64_01125 [Candidatus Gastranaerophilales bacterium]|nr:hypothetical protein [Candidatus Gastranaerophilales bacterium]